MSRLKLVPFVAVLVLGACTRVSSITEPAIAPQFAQGGDYYVGKECDPNVSLPDPWVCLPVPGNMSKYAMASN
jgi:hypothetical protein